MTKEERDKYEKWVRDYGATPEDEFMELPIHMSLEFNESYGFPGNSSEMESPDSVQREPGQAPEIRMYPRILWEL